MKSKMIAFIIVLLILLIMCVGCTSSEITMPYSSEEYVNGGWTIEDLEKHFEDLGFTEIEIIGNTTEITGIYAENDDSLFESFEKGAEISASHKIWIYTDFESTSPLTVANCPEFAKFVESGIESPENNEEWISFLESNSGKLLEFDGTITDWYDDLFWVGVSFTIAIEDSEYMNFSESSIDLIELGLTGKYQYNKYHAGLIDEGMRVHVITKITQAEDGCNLELDSMQIIE